MAGGALGLSSGLEYTPGSFASTEELIELSRVAAADGRRLRDPHARRGRQRPRSRGPRPCASPARRPSGSRSPISRSDYAAELAEDRRAHGHAREGQGGGPRFPLRPLSLHRRRHEPVPRSSRSGREKATTEDFIARLKDPALDARLRAALAAQEKGYGSWDRVLISSVGSDKNRAIEGMNVLEAATKAGKAAYEFMRDLLIEESGRVGMITFYGQRGRSQAHPGPPARRDRRGRRGRRALRALEQG